MIRAKGMSILLGLALLLATEDLRAQETGPSLGAKAEAVKAMWGQPLEDLGSVMRFEKCDGAEGGAKWALVFMPVISASGEIDTSQGGKLTAVQRFACSGEQLGEVAVQKEVAEIVPADAKFVREFRTKDDRKVLEYLSSSLASLFVAGDFVTCDTEDHVLPAVPGTFSYARASDGLSWFLGLGSCL